ncbi:MAG TPA: hypothetical protein G4O14_01120 [Anaerolineae bacterium]|nr:hypothetical protein [Anaerolineae bacterium]
MKIRHHYAFFTWLLLLILSVGGCSSPISSSQPPTNTLIPVTRPPSLTSTAIPISPTPITIPEIVEPFHPVFLPENLQQQTFSILGATKDGKLWLRSNQTIVTLEDRTWSVNLSDFSGDLIGLYEDGTIWISSEDGSEISTWDGTSWTTFTEDDGWVPLKEYERVHYGVVGDHQGRVWLATDQDVRVFDGHGWRIFTPMDMGLSPLGEEELRLEFSIAFIESLDEIWVGTCYRAGPGPVGGQGVVRYDGTSWRSGSDEVSSGCTTVMAEDILGRIWFGSDGVLWRFEPDSMSWIQFEPPSPPTGGGSFFNWVPVITLDLDNEPWAELLICGGGGCNGEVLYHVHDESWIQIMEPNSHYDRKLVIDAVGTPWLFVQGYPWGEVGAIYRIEDNLPKPISDLRLRANDVTLDRDGRIWFVVEGEEGHQLWVLENDTSQ